MDRILPSTVGGRKSKNNTSHRTNQFTNDKKIKNHQEEQRLQTLPIK